MHTCSKCGASFAAKAHGVGVSWLDSLTRADRSLAASRSDLENIGKVKCPQCGQVEDSTGLRAFGLLKRWQLKAVMVLLLLGVAVFSAADLARSLR